MGVKIRYRQLKDNKQSVYLDISKNGKRSYESLDDMFLYTKAKTEDEKFFNKKMNELISIKVKEREIQLLNSKFDFASVKKPSVDFLSLFKQEVDIRLKKRGKRSNTYCSYRHLLNFTNGKLSYKELDEQFVSNFKEYLLSKVGTNCAKTYFLRFKMILTMAHKRGFIEIDPSLNVKPIREIQPKREVLSKEEVQLLKQIPCKDDLIKRMFLFSCFTGLRISDLKAIKWKDVQDNFLRFHPVKTKEKFMIIPLNETARHYMGDRQNPEDHIFKWRFTGEGNRYDILRQWIWLDAGIRRNITWHTARHTYATLLLGTTRNLKLVKEALGHTRIETTEIYAKLLPTTLEEGVYSLDYIT